MPDFRSFFVDPDKIRNNHFTLNKKESHHLSNVLRIKSGELVWLIDGVGTTYNGVIENILPEKVSGTIKEVFPKYGEPTCDVFLAIGIIKRARMELAIEKATECGVRTITTVPMDRSIKRSIYNLIGFLILIIFYRYLFTMKLYFSYFFFKTMSFSF